MQTGFMQTEIWNENNQLQNDYVNKADDSILNSAKDWVKGLKF